MIAHALGAIGGIPYTNSLEAFACNYGRGFRWFEVDLALTQDNELVCFHSGHESNADLRIPVERLPVRDVEGKPYAQRYPIRRFSELLESADRLGDVVLVTDTKTWSDQMVDAFRRSVTSATRVRPRTRFVLQSYGEQDIGDVKRLALEIGAEIILTLYMTGADDEQVEALARSYGAVAVVVDARRFSPWLAERLHAVNIPILVHTINDHLEILKLTHAGADGFYTDVYRPYESAAGAPAQAAECPPLGQATRAVLSDWMGRDLLHPGDYSLPVCAKRMAEGIELTGCEAAAMLTSAHLSVPPQETVHLELDIEAGAAGANFWLEMLHKNRSSPLRARENLVFRPSERRLLSFDVNLPHGSPGVSTRLGMGSARDRVLVRSFKLFHANAAPEARSMNASRAAAAARTP